MSKDVKSIAHEPITARKRSLEQGNIFIGVCQEFCSQGGVSAPRGAGLGGVWLGGVTCSQGCLVRGGVPGPGMCAWFGGVPAPRGGW